MIFAKQIETCRHAHRSFAKFMRKVKQSKYNTALLRNLDCANIAKSKLSVEPFRGVLGMDTTLHRDGYVLIQLWNNEGRSRFYNRKQHSQVIDRAQKICAPIFQSFKYYRNRIGINTKDNKRRSAPFSSFIDLIDFKSLFSMIESVIQTKFKGLKFAADDTSLLLSEEGAEEQEPHCDAPLTEANFSDLQSTFPLSCLMSLDQKSSLIVWPGSHKTIWEITADNIPEPITPIRVRIPLGWACFFSQYLVHAGDSNRNGRAMVRLHLSFDGPQQHRQENETQPILHLTNIHKHIVSNASTL